MAKVYQLSRKRPHIVLPPNKKPTKSSRPPTPFTTFTALLDAAKSCDTSTEYPAKCDAAPAPVSSVTKRRLQNRESCRKTRLKRKLQQHAQDVLARERQARNEYLTQLADKLGVETRSKSQEDARDTLFRELATKSLHYALVDSEYSGWLDDSSDVASSNAPATAEMAQESEGEAHSSTRKSKRLRRSRDIDVAAASRSEPLTPQASLLSQWRLLVDGLQNVVLKPERIEERDLGAGVIEQLCQWRFVGVNSVKVQRDGEIDAVAMTGTTRVQFHRLHVQDVDIEMVQREHDVPFEFEAK
ncbi:hypothetical protein PHYSODRAFT_361616 [Phytophthora sojae]|uniref:BZIP domain-containing protein n=1 Tax=Phytophthora sojae (strain P6497) TaxID=1094619 RepID=G4ZZM8_PHYSP|nr:hypothetical protein PHYSODRAFT_361616 [Phytophthora sojae]EGZ10374.1 hypothetical protein PHYSODRAFT_361616 [Phytophthora sojae]|eukprot:XP_009533119.1 hypothetical protein PHYSODRAFT_361616 [Phytophthora sojae]